MSAGGRAGGSPPSTNKPSTYHTLLRELILSSKDQALTLNQIYDQMERDHPDISVSRPGWKNTTRHCLSMQPCFQLREKPFPQPGRGGYWTVDVTAPDTYPRNRNRKKKQPRSGSLSPTSLSSSAAQPNKKPRRSSTAQGDSNAVASSSGSRDAYFSPSQDGDVASDLSELSPFPPSALEAFDGRDGPFEDDPRRGLPQHPFWAPLNAQVPGPSNPYDGRSLGSMQSSSYPPYAYMANGVYPAPMPAYPYPYQPSPSYGQQSSQQQPLSMFQAQAGRSSHQPGPREYGQPQQPPLSYPPSIAYGNTQPHPHGQQARVAHPGQPFYPSYHPPPFPTQMAGHPSSAPSTSQPMTNGGYPHMSSAASSSSSASPTISHPSQQQQQRYQPQALYGHHLHPSMRAPGGAQQPVAGVEDSGLPTPQSSSSAGSHPLHLTSLMNAEIGGLLDGDGESEGGSGLVTPKLEGGGVGR